MVVPINNIANENKPKQNVTVNYSTNLTTDKIQNPLVNPNFTNVQNGKALNPTQQITVIGKGTDPEVITNHPTKINPYAKEQPTETQTLVKPQTTTQTTNLTPQDVLGPIMNRYLNYDPNSFANTVLQITNGLTLPELFQILGQNPKFWAPSYSSSSFPNGSSTYVANVQISGNKITFSNQTQINESWSNGGSYNSQVVNTLTIEPYNVTKNGKTYHLILVKEKQYNYTETISPHSNPDVYQDTLTWYYIIDPTTKKIIYQGQEPPQQSQYWLPEPQSGYIAQPSQVINNILQQYGYALPSNVLQEINNLQPGQSITVFARVYNSQLQEWGAAGAEFIITYLGNNQYQIKSVDRFYDFYNFNNPWTSINETITVPTYSINQQGQISTTNLSISGQITTYGTTNINLPYYTATYNVNETIPINYGYNTQTGQLTFWSGNLQGGVTLQSIDLPTITKQQLQALENGQNIGLKPGWYYNPDTGEIINVSYQTIQQPQVSNQYSYIFYNPNVPYSTTNSKVAQYIAVNTNTDTIYFLNPYGQVLNSISFANIQALNNYLYQNYGITLTNNGPVITTSTNTQNTAPTITTIQSSTSTSSLSIPTIINDIWNGLTTIGNDIYSWFTSLSKPQNNILQLNYQQLAQEVLYSQASIGTTTSYSTNTPTNQPRILQYSFFSPQILSDIWTGITTLGNDVYSWFTGLFSSKGSTNSSNNTLNLNYQQLAQEVLYGSSQSTINPQIQIVPSNSVSGISGSLYYQQLTQQINNNPYYPYTTSTSPYFNLTTIPAITDTTATYAQMNAINTINQIKNVQSGITTYDILSNISSLLGAKNTAKYYQTLSQQAQIYGSPSFYQAEQLGQTERLIATITAASLPLTIVGVGLGIADIGAEIGAEEIGSSILPRITLSTALTRLGVNAAIGAGEYVGSGEITSYALTGKPLSTQQALELAAEGAGIGATAGIFSLFAESPNSLLASLGTQFTPLNFAKNLGLNIGGSLISSNVYSYITSGQLPSLQQDIYSIEEAGPATLAFSSIAGILESPNIANNFLKLVTSENSNKYWPIAARVLYDTGANSLAMFGSSLTAQGVGNLIGAQQGINLEEAATSALFATVLTGLTEGIYAFRNPGAFVKSLGYYPQKFDLLSLEPTKVDKENMLIWLYGRGNEILSPKLGNRFYTKQDFSNIEPLNMPFDVTGYIQAKMGEEIETEGEETTQGLNTIKYTGRLKITSGQNTVITTPEGFIQLTGMPIENFEQYLANAQALANDIASVRPEFSELANVPWQGTYLFAKTTEGNLPEVIEGLNKGQTIAQIENGNIYYSSELETFIFPSVWNRNIGPFPNPTYLDWRFPLSYLQTGEYNYYFVRPFYNLPEESEEFALEIAPGVYRPLTYQIPSGIESTSYEDLFEEPEGYLVYKYKVPTRFNANNPNRMVVWREQGTVSTSLGQTYKGYNYGISATYETGETEGVKVSSISTSAGILREQGSDNYWGIVSQGGSVSMRDTLYRTPKGELQNIQFGFGYTKGIDPNQEYQIALQMLQNTQQSIQQSSSNLEITPGDILTALQGVAKQKIVMPIQSYSAIKPYTNYGFSIVTINQNAINSNNNYNISMSRVPNMVQQINNVAQQLQYNEKPILNEYNIQNELSTIRENLNEEVSSISGWTNQIQVSVSRTKPLKNYGKELYYNVQTPVSQENSIKSNIKPLNLGKNLLRENEKGKHLKRNEDNIHMLLPEFGLIAAEIYREETTKPLIITTTTTKIKTKPISPPPTKHEPTPPPPIPPPNTPREYPPFGFPEITIMGQPIRGLVPGLSRGVRSMYDIQYALSRLTL